MEQSHRQIILGSNSPRRKELLGGLDVEFTVDTGNTFEESIDPDVEPEMVPVLMAQGKSHGFHRPLEDGEILITADTVVIVEGKVLGKPHSREDALQMLSMLSGRKHDVVTAVTIRDISHETTFADTTAVSFCEISEEDAAYYVDTYKPFDKAGAYGIQEWIGYALISGIEGSYFNVMGFPVHRVYAALKDFR